MQDNIRYLLLQVLRVVFSKKTVFSVSIFTSTVKCQANTCGDNGIKQVSKYILLYDAPDQASCVIVYLRYSNKKSRPTIWRGLNETL